uniref:Transmembrane protein n=1 Tax=Ananas comosus var. bracteatus TaxID=296719 RepID=A0A6V7PQW7_ANACO|nr:unnamed protein product [Ananas comosus var. bracteatus]
MGRVLAWVLRWWPEFGFSVRLSSIARSVVVFHWPERLDFSNLTAAAALRWRPEIDFSVFDAVLWPVVVAFESVALLTMLCFYFTFCGCTLTGCEKPIPFALMPNSSFRWLVLDFASFLPSWALTPYWWWPDLRLSVVDDILWAFVVAVETVAIVLMMFFFFVFCGCSF